MSKQFLKIRNGTSYPGLSADPSDPANGDFYYNTTSNVFRQYTNSAWSNVPPSASPTFTGTLTVPDVTLTGSGNALVLDPTTTTSNIEIAFDNAGGVGLIGQESSVGGQIVAGAPAYAMAITPATGQSLVLGYNDGAGIALSINSSGNTTIAKNALVSGTFQSGGTATTTALSLGQTVTVGNTIAVNYANFPGFFGYRANGTEASPTAAGAGVTLADFAARGYDGTAWSGDSARMSSVSVNAWTTSDHSSKLVFSTTPTGSTTLTTALTLDSSQNATFNGTVTADDGFVNPLFSDTSTSTPRNGLTNNPYTVFTGSAAITLNGVVNGVAGQVIYMTNNTGSTMTITRNSGSVVGGASPFLTNSGANISLPSNGSAMFIYNSAGYWQVISPTA